MGLFSDVAIGTLLSGTFLVGYMFGREGLVETVSDWVTQLRTQWSQKIHRFYHPIPVDPTATNVLILCHGATLNKLDGLVDYSTHRVYTVDCNSMIEPDFWADLSYAPFWKEQLDASYDVVIACFCHCHTKELVLKRGKYILEQIHRILKPGGRLLTKSLKHFQVGAGPDGSIFLEPADIERHGYLCSEVQLRDFAEGNHYNFYQEFYRV